MKVFRIDPLAYFQHPQARGRHRPRSRRPRREPRAGAALRRAADPPRAPPHRAADVRARRHVRHRSDRQRDVEPRGRAQGPAAVTSSRDRRAGHVVTIVDDAGRAAPRRARVARRSRVHRRRARHVRRAVLDRAERDADAARVPATSRRSQQLELVRETYALAAARALDRQALAAGRTARAIARVQLAVAGAPASLALLERATLGRHAHRSRRRRDDEVAAARARRRRRRRARVADGRGHRARRDRGARHGRGRQRAARAGARASRRPSRSRRCTRPRRPRRCTSRAARPAGSCRRSASPASRARSRAGDGRARSTGGRASQPTSSSRPTTPAGSSSASCRACARITATLGGTAQMWTSATRRSPRPRRASPPATSSSCRCRRCATPRRRSRRMSLVEMRAGVPVRHAAGRRSRSDRRRRSSCAACRRATTGCARRAAGTFALGVVAAGARSATAWSTPRGDRAVARRAGDRRRSTVRGDQLAVRVARRDRATRAST